MLNLTWCAKLCESTLNIFLFRNNRIRNILLKIIYISYNEIYLLIKIFQMDYFVMKKYRKRLFLMLYEIIGLKISTNLNILLKNLMENP